MDPKRAKSIFLHAVEHVSPGEWPRYLDEACSNDTSLRHGVELLLTAHEENVDLVEQARRECDIALSTVDQPTDGKPGTRIGPYKLLQEIGQGGMGVVYMAEQTEPVRRKVALKIIRPGMDSRQIIARFEAERQALSLMDHPNIARVLDAGTTDSGRPYFVMELVKGQAITQYCDEKHLTPRQRLELLAPVCQAVQHAHQKGIIHRDIKPSNILVAEYDQRPVPKVIDFGVAKATSQQLTERTMFTGFGQIVGTLEYMSPEQAKVDQLDIDTRSDIYSLGVLIYELLTGSTPFDKRRIKSAAWDEILRIIREEEPPRPSVRLSESRDALPSISALRQMDPAQLTKLVRGELDWIVMKAMEKDRDRRYETANSLAADVQRYLGDEPVQACPPSVVYRLRKFVRRNRAPLVMAAAMLLVLVAGVVATSLGLIQAIHARKMAVDAWKNEARQRYAAELERTRAEKAEAEAVQQAERATASEIRARESEKQTRKEAQHATSARHALQIEEAFKAWERHDVRDAERRLGEIDAAFQGSWEQRFLQELCKRKANPLTGHTGSVSSTAFSSDGTRLITGSFDGTIRIWDADSDREARVILGHNGRVMGVAISNDGRLIASGGALWDERNQQYTSGELKVWDAQTGTELRSLPGHTTDVFCVAFSPDSRWLASGSGDKTIRVWDATTGELQLMLPEHPYEITGVTFSPDGLHIVSWSGGNIVVWDVGTGKERLRFRGGETATGCVAFSPDGSQLVTASGGSNPGVPGEIRVFDAATGERIKTFAARDRWLRSVAFSPDGQLIAAGGGEFGQPAIVQVLDAATGRELYLLSGHNEAIYSVAFSPDGRQIISASQDQTARVWNPAVTPETLTLAGDQLPVQWLAFSADATKLAASGTQQGVGGVKGNVRVWETSTGRIILKLAGDKRHANSLVFRPNGQQLVTAGGLLNRPTEVNVLEAATGRELHRLHGLRNYVVALALSADGRRLAALIYHDTVQVWDATTWTEISTIRATHNGPCTCLAINGDGHRVITGSTDGTVRIWETQTGREKLVLQAHARGVSTLAISPDELLIASGEGNPDGSYAGEPGEVKLWNASSGKLEQTCLGHTEPVTGVAFLSDGRSLISGSRDSTVRLWDTATGQIKLCLDGGSGSVLSVASSRDGLSIAAGNADGTARLWRISQSVGPESVPSQ